MLNSSRYSPDYLIPGRKYVPWRDRSAHPPPPPRRRDTPSSPSTPAAPGRPHRAAPAPAPEPGRAPAPPPTPRARHPRARDDLRERARALRRQGWSYDRIRAEPGCSKSPVSLWGRDLPRPAPRHTAEERRSLTAAGLARLYAEREAARVGERRAAAEAVGTLSDRELFLAGVALHWAEGSKSKPHRRTEALQFINSDPDVIRLHLRWLRLPGVAPGQLALRVSIHESADVAAAERHWAAAVGTDAAAFRPATLKRHNPRTARRNTVGGHHGRLVIHVRKSAQLYRRTEGAWYGIVGAAGPAT
jgi:hypothetical protein